jgi:hypothetical protein
MPNLKFTPECGEERSGCKVYEIKVISTQITNAGSD